MRIFVVFLASVLFFTSCSKDGSNDPNPPGSQDSTTLSSYVVLDISDPASSDTLEVLKYYYDTDKRISTVEVYWHDPTPLEKHTIRFRYNANDTLPYRIDMEYTDLTVGGPSDLIEVLYPEYANGTLVYDSLIIVEDAEAYVRTYEYDGERIDVTRLFYVNNVLFSNEITSHYVTRMNGNIIQQRDTTNGVISVSNFTYDDKANPFSGLFSHITFHAFSPFYFIDSYNSDINLGKNNPLAIDQTEGGFRISRDRLSYTYKTNGYPSIVNITDADFPNVRKKGIFIYTRL